MCRNKRVFVKLLTHESGRRGTKDTQKNQTHELEDPRERACVENTRVCVEISAYIRGSGGTLCYSQNNNELEYPTALAMTLARGSKIRGKTHVFPNTYKYACFSAYLQPLATRLMS
jgi:hypothetical protein